MCNTFAMISFALKDDKGRQGTTKGRHALRPFAMSYTILQYSTVLPFTLRPFLTFSDTFRPFATFLDFALFNTPPVCITFSGTFHQTLFTWLVHHSFSFSAIISVRSALHFTNISRFILLLQLYLCFLLPPLPNRTESSPFTCTTVYWPQISLAFLVYCTDRCRLFCNFVAPSIWTYRLPEQHFLITFGSQSSYLYTHSPPFPLQETGYPLLAL